jgi:hypothetical protein
MRIKRSDFYRLIERGAADKKGVGPAGVLPVEPAEHVPRDCSGKRGSGLTPVEVTAAAARSQALRKRMTTSRREWEAPENHLPMGKEAG